jgi:Flp pilus assembly protein TadD
MIEGKKPSFGYVVLANLMAQNYINTVITTNFDDLIYNACSTFTDIRPVVYAYGTMISDLRITNARPKILKLHGDYLYSKLKNSGAELAHQDPNMSRHVPILLNEYGLVVVGYSGCDASVMQLLRQIPPTNDLYWCGHAGSPMPESVRSLLVDVEGMYVEIEGFDQLMNEIRLVAGFDVPRMLGSLEARHDEMIDQLKSFPRDLPGLAALMREISNFYQQDDAERQRKAKKEAAFLHYVNALEATQEGDFVRTEEEFKASLELNPDDVMTRLQLASLYVQEGHYKEAESELAAVRPHATGDDLNQFHYVSAYLYAVQGREEEALNECLAVIQASPQDAAAHNAAGFALMSLGRLNEAGTALQKALELDPSSYFPVFNGATLMTVKGDVEEAQRWWSGALARFQSRGPIDRYNQAIITAALGKTDEAKKQMGDAVKSGRPGLAALALQSVRLLDSAPSPIPGVPELRKMLEVAAVPETAPQPVPEPAAPTR